MGGITSSIAAKLAFFPPKTPSYKIITDNLTGLYTLSSFPHHENVELLKLPTRRGTEIVAVYVRNPMASLSLLYSHGNATDLGQMYELFIQLSIYLKVNLMGVSVSPFCFLLSFYLCLSSYLFVFFCYHLVDFCAFDLEFSCLLESGVWLFWEVH